MAASESGCQRGSAYVQRRNTSRPIAALASLDDPRGALGCRVGRPHGRRVRAGVVGTLVVRPLVMTPEPGQLEGRAQVRDVPVARAPRSRTPRCEVRVSTGRLGASRAAEGGAAAGRDGGGGVGSRGVGHGSSVRMGVGVRVGVGVGVSAVGVPVRGRGGGGARDGRHGLEGGRHERLRMVQELNDHIRGCRLLVQRASGAYSPIVASHAPSLCSLPPQSPAVGTGRPP